MAKKKSKSPVDEFMALPDEQKEAAWAEFDKEFVGETFRPLNARQRRLWEKAKRKVGRPKVGAGAKRVLVSVEGSLLKRADAYAKAHGLSRSKLISKGLLLALTHDPAGPV
jgi:hypothetical protein